MIVVEKSVAGAVPYSVYFLLHKLYFGVHTNRCSGRSHRKEISRRLLSLDQNLRIVTSRVDSR